MDGGNNNNNNPNLNRLTAESLPVIDTRLLSQSELLALSHSSSFSPSSLADSVDGDIDRSVFNESAGSRKQTFNRLRLSRHPPTPQPTPPPPQLANREENLQIASLLRSLFKIDTSNEKKEDEEEENEGEEALIPIPILECENPNIDSIKNLLNQGISTVNETVKRRGRPRRIQNHSELVGCVTVDSDLRTESRFDDLDDTGIKRKRGRPRKSVDTFNKEFEDVSFENREGVVVDVSVLGSYEDDPYGEELRRVTVEMKTKEELLGFLEGLSGEWVNVGKKKKVVEACGYGGYLPKGWKLMLCVKKNGNEIWLACRKYVSPGGQEFETCKEVSAYLQSLLDSRSKNQLNDLQSDNRTLGEPAMMADESLVGNSDSIDLPDLNAETNQNLESRTTNSVEGNGAENGGIIEPVKSSLVEKNDKGIPTAKSLNVDNKDDMKKGDNTENLVVPSNAEAQSKEFVKDLPWTTGEIERIWGSRNP